MIFLYQVLHEPLSQPSFPYPFIYPYTLCCGATHLREIIESPGTSSLSKTHIKDHSARKSSFLLSHASYCFVPFYIHCLYRSLVLHWFNNL